MKQNTLQSFDHTMRSLQSSATFAQYSLKTKERFSVFHSENPGVYEEFKKLAFDMKYAGKKKYSAQALVYVLRWNKDVSTKGDVFKINNDFTSIYARMMMSDYPVMEGFFSIRKESGKGQKSSEQIRRELSWN